MLASLTQEMNAQSAELRHLAYESRTDARLTKILGFVATIYLPASLIAVNSQKIILSMHLLMVHGEQSVFSSDLIQLPQSDVQTSTVLHVSRAMWVFTLLSISLTGFTLAGTLWWIKRKEKQS